MRIIITRLLIFFPDNLNLVSQELVKLAKDNGSSDNITIVVVFLKPIDDLVTMELPITKEVVDETDCTNNNDKEALYDGITSTSIFVGKNATHVDDDMEDNDDDNDDASSSETNNGSGNPFTSPHGGGFSFGEVVNPFSGMTKDNDSDDIPAADQSLEGMINEAFGTVAVTKLDDFKTASPSMFADDSMSPSVLSKPSNDVPDFMASTEHSWINHGTPASAMSNNPFLIGGKGDSGFISPACQSNNHR